jgi:hypothetical protein
MLFEVRPPMFDRACGQPLGLRNNAARQFPRTLLSRSIEICLCLEIQRWSAANERTNGIKCDFSH